jgi:hypothetical protein
MNSSCARPSILRGPAYLPSLRGLGHIGKPTHIVSPCLVEVIIQEDGWKRAKFEAGAGSESLDHLPGVQVFLVRVGPDNVETSRLPA